jgi:hypothetical protein
MLSSNLMTISNLPGYTPSAWKSKTLWTTTPSQSSLSNASLKKTEQTATGKLDKLKARLVARGADQEKRRMKKTKAAYHKQIQQQCQDLAQSTPANSPHVQPIEIPQPLKTHGLPAHLQEG